MSQQPPSMFDGRREVFLERPLPSSELSEKAILGAVLLNNNLISEVYSVLKPEDFYSPMHRRIYQGMLALHDAFRPIDPILLGDELSRDGSVNSIGGVAAITNLTFGLPHFTSIDEYVKQVRDTSDARKLIRVCNQITSAALEEEEGIEKLLERAEGLIYNVRTNVDTTRAVPMAEEIGYEIILAKERSETGDVVVGIPTGFADLDFKLQGYRKQEQIVIGARPSIGKTALLLRELYHASAHYGATVLFFSIEMSKAEIASRIICSEACIDTYLWRSGNLTDEQWEKAEEVRAKLQESEGFFIYDSPFVSMRTVRREIRRVNSMLAAQGKPPLAVVATDHVGLMENEEERTGVSREREISIISRGYKQCARQFDLTTILLSQINRLAESRAGHRPMMSDLRESGSLEQDADVVKLIYREDYYQEDPELHTGVAEIIVGKNRNGPTGPVKVSYQKKFTRFGNLSELAEASPVTQFVTDQNNIVF